MPTYATNILPSTTGLALGNTNQQWIAYLSNAFTGTVQSLSNLPALSGFVRLASTDFIAWRNNSNTADITLSKAGAAVTTTPADVLIPSSGIVGPFISHNANPASAGELRLATADLINFRNNANSGDIPALQHNSDDTISVGGGAGVDTNGPLSVAGAVTATGAVNGATGSVIANVRINTGSISTPSGNLSITATGGTLVLGTNVSSYNAYALAGNGLVSNIVATDLTAQTAAITATNLLTGSGSGPAAGQYRVSWNAKITTAATTGAATSTLGPFALTYIDPDGVSQTITAAAMITAGTLATTSAGNTTTTVLLGLPMLINVKALSTVSYTFGYASNTAAQMAYNLHIVVERL
jgi:hypothetical protein